MFLVNSRFPHFSAIGLGFRSKSLHPARHTFFRSYGAILPSSLARVFSTPWNVLPTHLCRFPVRAPTTARLEAFLGSVDLFSLRPLRASSSRLAVTACGICHADLATRLNRHIRSAAEPSYSVPPSLERHHQWYGNINPFAIAYAFRPRLRTRLTLSRLALPRNPWVFGGQVSHLSSRYSCRHKLLKGLQ